MRKRLLVASVCMLVVPLFAPNKPRTTHTYPFTTVALAGHTTSGIGGWCECGGDGCLCDAGETPHSKNAYTPNRKHPSSNPTSESGLGEFALLGALMFALLLRLSMR